MKNILIISSGRAGLVPLLDCLECLRARGYSISLISRDQELIDKFKEKNWPAKELPRIFGFNCLTKSRLAVIFFPLVLPLSFLFLLYWKYKMKIKTLILASDFSKLAFTGPAKILGLKSLWLELPGDFNARRPAKTLLRANSRWAEVIAFAESTKQKLIKGGWREKNIKKIFLGQKQKGFLLQNDIFSELAWSEKRQNKKKFFTIGAIVDLDPSKLGSAMEIFFQAIKKTLSVIPHLQIIIAGEGKDKKNLSWLAKKMGIGNLVWFVGKSASPSQIKKWLSGFDAFAAIYEYADLEDLSVLLTAKASKLPVIAFSHAGLEDYVGENNGVFSRPHDSEMLAQKIIWLYRNKNLREALGQDGYNNFYRYFTAEKMAEELQRIIS